MRYLILLVYASISFVAGCRVTQTGKAVADLTVRLAEETTKIGGLTGDGIHDNTAALQNALDAAGRAGGGVVQLPLGRFLVAGSLNIPTGVALEGRWRSVPAHNGLRDRGLPKPTDDGTTLLITGGAGDENGEPFITLNTNSTLKGVCIFYPDQKIDDVPTPYPYAIAMRGKNPAVLDVELLNPYNGIDASQNERHLIRNVSGQPLRRGVYVDNILDIGRIENVHFNPWFSHGTKLFEWQMENGEAFIFGRADWEYVLNTFCFGYNVGYRFIQTEKGVCNGNFLGIGADDCFTALQVDNCAPMALLITNGEFVSFHGPDPTMIRVSETNQGAVRFVNCAFWGPCKQIAKIAGTGTVGFADCTFMQWGGKDGQIPAIQADSGTVLVRGCEFYLDRPQIHLANRVGRAVITDNVITGAERIVNQSSGKVVISNNAAAR